jgi:hypothetical protein
VEPGSVFGIETGYGLDDRGVRCPGGGKNFHFSKSSGVHTTSYPMGTGGSLPGGKAAGALS